MSLRSSGGAGVLSLMAGKPSNYCNNHQRGVSYTLGTVTGASYRIPKTLSGDKYPPFKVKPELRRSNKLPKVRELRSEFQAHSPGPSLRDCPNTAPARGSPYCNSLHLEAAPSAHAAARCTRAPGSVSFPNPRACGLGIHSSLLGASVPHSEKREDI